MSLPRVEMLDSSGSQTPSPAAVSGAKRSRYGQRQEVEEDHPNPARDKTIFSGQRVRFLCIATNTRSCESACRLRLQPVGHTFTRLLWESLPHAQIEEPFAGCIRLMCRYFQPRGTGWRWGRLDGGGR